MLIQERERYPQNLKSLINFILKDKIKNVKFSVLNKIYNNWVNIVGQKYLDYCYPSKISLDHEQKTGSLYIVCYNPAVSFFLNNNKIFILEKINFYFGYKAIKNFFIIENPMVLKNNYIQHKKENLTEEQTKLIENINKNQDDKLSQSLRFLTKSIFEYKIE